MSRNPRLTADRSPAPRANSNIPFQGESLKLAIRRLRNSSKIAFEKSKYEKSLSDLRDHNSQLCQLRSHLGDFQNRRTCPAGRCIGRKTLPSKITAIQQASQKLHEALSNAWCCGDLAHAGHFAKICLDAEVQAGVHLDLAISCHEKESGNNERYLIYFALYVRTPRFLGYR